LVLTLGSLKAELRLVMTLLERKVEMDYPE